VQGTGLFPHLTVFENIALLVRVSGQQQMDLDEKIDYLMNLVDLDLNYKQQYPHQLSGGEQQRVGICRAMILDPPIFLLDEAFGALDVSTRKELQQEILKLQDVQPRTIILVTHDVEEAFVLADKILILHNGQVQQYDHPDKLKNNPANPFVEQFIQI
jgi:osmoprotectant transport system ATP-binding protein